MKFFKLAWAKIKSSPRHYVSVFLLLTLMYICVLFVSSAMISSEKYDANNNKLKFSDARISVYNSEKTMFESFEQLPEHEHVLFYTTTFYHSGKTNLESEYYNGTIAFNGIDLESTEVKLDIDKDIEADNFIIVPEKFTPTSEGQTEHFIKGKEFIGSEIVYKIIKKYKNEDGTRYGEYTGETINFTVIGTYKNNDYMNTSSVCLISFENLCYLQKKEADDDVLAQKGTVYAIVDSVENLETVAADLKDSDCYISLPDGDSIMVKVISAVMYMIASVATVAASVNLFSTILSATDRRKHQMAVFKAVGYSDGQIFAVNLLEYLIPNFAALIIATAATIPVILATYSTDMNNSSRFMMDFDVFSISWALCLCLGLIIVTVAVLSGLIRFSCFDFKYLTETEDD